MSTGKISRFPAICPNYIYYNPNIVNQENYTTKYMIAEQSNKMATKLLFTAGANKTHYYSLIIVLFFKLNIIKFSPKVSKRALNRAVCECLGGDLGFRCRK